MTSDLAIVSTLSRQGSASSFDESWDLEGIANRLVDDELVICVDKKIIIIIAL